MKQQYLCFIVFLLLIINFHFHAAVATVPMTMHIMSICKHILAIFKPHIMYRKYNHILD